MKRILFGVAGLAAIFNLSALALADTTPPPEPGAPNQSVVVASPSLADKVTFSYWANYAGPSISTPNSANPAADGTFDSKQSLDTLFIGYYKISPTLLIGPYVEFHYQPVAGQDIHLNDTALVLRKNEIINRNGFKLNGDVMALTPTDPDSRKQDKIGGTRVSLYPSYTTGNLTLAIYSYAKNQYFSVDTGDQKQYDLRLIVAPNMAYAVSKDVQLTVWVDAYDLRHYRGRPGAYLQNLPTDWEPGFNWDVSQHFSVNPYINIYQDTPTLKATYAGVVVSGKLL